MASVVVGKPINGVTLTEMREMEQCPKADSARSRVVATNAISNHKAHPKDIKAIKNLVKLRVLDPLTPFFSKGMILYFPKSIYV